MYFQIQQLWRCTKMKLRAKPSVEALSCTQQQLPGIVLMMLTIQSARELRDDITFGCGEDCVTQSRKQLNPERVSSILQKLRVTEIADLSGWRCQTMCDPGEPSVQHLQIRPRPRSWS